MTVQLQPLSEFYQACMSADFDFERSDDPGWYRAEEKKIAALREQARVSPQHAALFEQFRTANGRGPLPARPVEEAAE